MEDDQLQNNLIRYNEFRKIY